MSRKRLAVLGSTGSIGTQTLDVVARESGRLTVTALAAGGDIDGLEAQARAVRPRDIALERAADPRAARDRLRAACPEAEVDVGSGAAARLAARTDADIVLNGIVGAAGLRASLATLERNLRLALANKESLVIGGALVHRALERGGELVPVDSEHSAALQCMGGRPPREVASLVLTASGGALRGHADWRSAARDEVLSHPVWDMGARITVDSALLFNKGLELIEARWLFDLDWKQLDAWIHPQTLVHAIVTFTDGSSVVQAAAPDMRLPIQLALSWPERWSESVAPLQPDALSGLEFEKIERGVHPAFDVAVDAGRAGGTAPCVLNAADEVAVAAFLEGQISLGMVPEIVRRVVESHAVEAVESADQLERIDALAREQARAAVVRS